jgi:hypothetical protein
LTGRCGAARRGIGIGRGGSVIAGGSAGSWAKRAAFPVVGLAVPPFAICITGKHPARPSEPYNGIEKL